MLILGEIYRSTNRIDEAKETLISASERGEVEALYSLGLIHHDEDINTAIEYYKRSANQGYEKAQTILGIIYFESGDLETSKYYYRLATVKQEPTALYNLAYILAEGGHYDEAKRLYELVAAKNFPGAKERLSWVESIESFSIKEISAKEFLSKFFDNPSMIDSYIKKIKNEIEHSQLSSILVGPGIPLCSSFKDKEKLKTLGARWCPQEKTWFIPFDFKRESFHEYLPLIYRNERNMFTPILVPRNLWSHNLRSFLPSKVWNELRFSTYKSTNYRCSVCGVKGNNLHCDEIWKYEPTNLTYGIVYFEGLWPLCAACHKVKHFGKAEADHAGTETFARMLFINEISEEEGEDVIDNAYKKWEEHSKINWKFDFHKLEENYGIVLNMNEIF